MRNAATKLIKYLFDRAELRFRSVLRAAAARRVDRLYGNLSPQPPAPRKGAERQSAVLAGIVEANCAARDAIAETHRSATLKLDSAEYALSMMIVELRDVMVAPRLSLAPEKKPRVPQFIRVADTAAQAA